MGVRVKTNVESLFAQRRLTENRRTLANSLEKLSSGQRINRSADDAAGLAVSERIRSRVRSLGVAKRNANDGISYIQVAEGGLNEVSNIVVRMRELASQAASDTIGNREREFLNREFSQLGEEVGRIMASTEFNGSKMLQLEEQRPIQIFVGSSNRAAVDGEIKDVDPTEDSDIVTIDVTQIEDLMAALSPIKDGELSVVPDSDDGGADTLNGNTNELFGRLDTAINEIAGYRAVLGSVQSRLNSTITNIEISNENLQAAQSRIRDVDYAEETAKYTQARILTQAGASVLTQANQQPELVLSLLR